MERGYELLFDLCIYGNFFFPWAFKSKILFGVQEGYCKMIRVQSSGFLKLPNFFICTKIKSEEL